MTERSKHNSWIAVHDFMPPGSGLLSVRGECTFPTPGYKVVLKKASSGEGNTNVLVLNKEVTPPTGPQAQIETTITAEYYEVTKQHYSQVEIFPDGVKIKVEDVH